jgi:hypothetical protein
MSGIKSDVTAVIKKRKESDKIKRQARKWKKILANRI